MKKVKHVYGDDEKFQGYLNEDIAELQKSNCVIIDIKYSSVYSHTVEQTRHYALIVYDENGAIGDILRKGSHVIS